MKTLKHQEIQSPNSGREIPIDLLIDIFSRVPAKTVARFRCLSKLWDSILSREYFTDLFLTMSLSRPPLLLFTLEDDDGYLVSFSTPHLHNPNENKSLIPTRYRVHHKIFPRKFSSKIGSSLCGFICRRDKGSLDTLVISNPVTGESISLPKVELKSNETETKPYLGYDPIDKELKLLCVTFQGVMNNNTFDEHQVLTLENGKKHLWRRVQCKPHYPKYNGVCIDGLLYYAAGIRRWIRVSMIVCFVVRSEKFSFINIDESMGMTTDSCTLINYKGKLGVLELMFWSPRRLVLWVLEDAEKSLWSKNMYTFPPLWNNIVERTKLIGMTVGGEVVLSTYSIQDPFYIYCFNLESKIFTRVQIQGLEVFNLAGVKIFLDYAENLKLM